MIISRRFVGHVLFTVLLGMLASISLAHAAAPTTTTSEFSINGTIACAGFNISEAATVTVRTTIFFDNAGNPVRQRDQATYTGTLTNSATGTSVAPHRGPQNFEIDLRDGTVAGHGVFFNLTVPGRGNILHSVGTIIFNPDGSMTLHGRHEFQGEDAVLCAALKDV
jgi:hypothetical protein